MYLLLNQSYFSQLILHSSYKNSSPIIHILFLNNYHYQSCLKNVFFRSRANRRLVFLGSEPKSVGSSRQLLLFRLFHPFGPFCHFCHPYPGLVWRCVCCSLGCMVLVSLFVLIFVLCFAPLVSFGSFDLNLGA